jgi:hypothetical protein
VQPLVILGLHCCFVWKGKQMRIHPSDPAAIARKVNLSSLTWKEIMALVHERAIKRQSLIEERKTMGHIMDEFVEG